jgi:septum formation topological specificity factor MinE
MDILDNYYLYIKLTNKIDETQKFEIIKIICRYITIFHIIHEDEIELSLFTNNIISILFNKDESNI